MQLTRFTDYALRVLIYLGEQSDRLVTIKEIAERHALSENHLVKIVHKLATCGYIETLRGKGGGMRLGMKAESINLGAVVRDTEENMNIAECFDASAQSCRLLPSCALKSVLNDAKHNFLATLDEYTLADLLSTHSKTAIPVRVTKRMTRDKTFSQ